MYRRTPQRAGIRDSISIRNPIGFGSAARFSFSTPYETGEVEYVDALGLEGGRDAPEGALRDGYDYYMTERAGAQTYPNYNHLAPSFMLEAPMLADAMSYAKAVRVQARIRAIRPIPNAMKPRDLGQLHRAFDPCDACPLQGSPPNPDDLARNR